MSTDTQAIATYMAENTIPQNRFPDFNPREHLITIKGNGKPSEYLEVKWRLVWFRALCPYGTIETEVVFLDLDKEVEAEVYVWNAEKRRSEKVVKTDRGVAVFRATVHDGRGGSATGTKSENAANFPDFIEKAESGSIGRALAALGYGTQFTGEDLNELPRIVDAPVETPASAGQGQPSGEQRAANTTSSATNGQHANTNASANSQSPRGNTSQASTSKSSESKGVQSNGIVMPAKGQPKQQSTEQPKVEQEKVEQDKKPPLSEEKQKQVIRQLLADIREKTKTYGPGEKADLDAFRYDQHKDLPKDRKTWTVADYTNAYAATVLWAQKHHEDWHKEKAQSPMQMDLLREQFNRYKAIVQGENSPVSVMIYNQFHRKAGVDLTRAEMETVLARLEKEYIPYQIALAIDSAFTHFRESYQVHSPLELNTFPEEDRVAYWRYIKDRKDSLPKDFTEKTGISGEIAARFFLTIK